MHPGAKPSTNRLLDDYLRVSTSERVALTDSGGDVSFKQLAALVSATAARLKQLGVRGQRVALLAEPSRHWLQGFWAILLAGGTVVPLSPLYPVAERRQLLRRSRAVLLLVSQEFASQAASSGVVDETDAQVPTWSLDQVLATAPSDAGLSHPSMDSKFGAGLSSAKTAPLGSAADQQTFEPDGATPVETQPALLLHTSGTTGEPKGALLSYANIRELVDRLRQAWGWQEDDHLLHFLPLHHLHGICVSLLLSFLSQTRTTLLRRFEPAEVCRAAAHCSVLMAVPTQHRKLVDYVHALPVAQRERTRSVLTQLRLVTSGSAKLPEGLGAECKDLFGQYPLERYGMTEIGVALSNPLVGNRRSGSCGQPLPGMEVRIVNDAGREADVGTAGEIWVRGPTVFLGYDQDPEATRAAFQDGYFRTGDTAQWLSDRFVQILGRTSIDIIKSGGYKLSALEIEERLREHPAVMDVAVVGLPDELWGEAAVAVWVPSEVAPSETALPESALREWAKKRLAPYKVPRRFCRRTTLPRNALGKVKKPILIQELSRHR